MNSCTALPISDLLVPTELEDVLARNLRRCIHSRPIRSMLLERTQGYDNAGRREGADTIVKRVPHGSTVRRNIVHTRSRDDLPLNPETQLFEVYRL